jgi:FkbM family methyltransferase
MLQAESTSRLQLRVKLGELIYRSGLHRFVLIPHHPPNKGLRLRLFDYLKHYLDQAEACPANLPIGEPTITLRCDLNDHMLKPYLFGERGLYEAEEINHCASYLRAGDVLLDIGANHGFWSFLLAAHQGGVARIVAVEANPELAERIRRSARLNPQFQVTVVNEALCGPGVSEVTFYLPLDNPVGNLSGLGSIVLHDAAREQGYLSQERAITCPATNLDALVERLQLPRLDLVKIDVEQAEDQVIEGGQRVFETLHPRLVMVETSATSRTTRYLLGLGYKAHILDEGKGINASIPEDFWGNIFFTWPAA